MLQTHTHRLRGKRERRLQRFPKFIPNKNKLFIVCAFFYTSRKFWFWTNTKSRHFILYMAVVRTTWDKPNWCKPISFATFWDTEINGALQRFNYYWAWERHLLNLRCNDKHAAINHSWKVGDLRNTNSFFEKVWEKNWPWHFPSNFTFSRQCMPWQFLFSTTKYVLYHAARFVKWLSQWRESLLAITTKSY